MLRGSNCYLTIPGGPSLLKVSLSPRFSGLQFVTGLLWSFSVLRHIVSGSEMIWLVSWSRTVLRAAARCEMNGVFLHVYGPS